MVNVHILGHVASRMGAVHIRNVLGTNIRISQDYYKYTIISRNKRQNISSCESVFYQMTGRDKGYPCL